MPSKLSVLIIEPDGFLAGIYGRKFEADGWKVYVAESLAEAVKMRTKNKIGAYVIEPDVDLAATKKFISEVRSNIDNMRVPLVILSGLADPNVIAEMKTLGANAYLIKGHFVPSEAVKKVRGLLAAKK